MAEYDSNRKSVICAIFIDQFLNAIERDNGIRSGRGSIIYDRWIKLRMGNYFLDFIDYLLLLLHCVSFFGQSCERMIVLIKLLFPPIDRVLDVKFEVSSNAKRRRCPRLRWVKCNRLFGRQV